MRPFDSFSTFSAHGTMKYFTGLATGGRKVWSRRVTSCDVAAVGTRANPDATTAPSIAGTIRFMAFPPGDLFFFGSAAEVMSLGGARPIAEASGLSGLGRMIRISNALPPQPGKSVR